jgi:tRNA(Arg) A34 adenosine deaminase TadA
MREKIPSIKRRHILLGASCLALYPVAKGLYATDVITTGDTMADHKRLLREAVRLAQKNGDEAGRPFGAVLALRGEMIAKGVNNIVQSHDISTHAEMEAIRAACRRLGKPDLTGGVMYASGHPCPMCLAAMVMAKVNEVYYAFGNDEAAPYGFSNAHVYEALRLPLPASLPMTRIDVGIPVEQVYGSELQRG